MKGLLRKLAPLLVCAIGAVANEQQIDDKFGNTQRCSGMYGRKSWGGDVEPYISTRFEKQTAAGGDADPIVSIAIFEWRDEGLIGRYPMPDSLEREWICDDENIKQNYCNETLKGAFIVSPEAFNKSRSAILTQAVHLKDAPEVKYSIKRTGYYCVGTYGYTAQTYKAVVEFRNAYGQLPAAQIAKLPFYGGLAIVYAVIGAFWAFLYFQHRHDILPVQNYITAILIFLTVEMLMTWGFYEYQNRHGSNVAAKALMTIVAVLNAGRNSFSFFLLLIVCLGYGVVKPSLGKTMNLVRGLAITHFVFGVIYAVASLSITPDSAGPIVLLVILPLAGTLTAFYVWTLNALNMTMKDLMARKQNAKAMMYRKLWWCILVSILVIFGFFFLNSFSFAGRSDPDFVPDNWQSRWFVLDGWLNIVYLVDLAFIAYLWRPTANNRRFAMSDELAQDDEGFEVTSFGGSLDEEAGTRSGDQTPRAGIPSERPAGTSSPPKTTTGQNGAVSTVARDPRESLDGEPIFAVGEDADRWAESDDESASPRNSVERKRLTGKDQ
ncbi:MAG: hypothetical protein M1816_004888 [Peltula sp. TS41687]|nr:MAG: hypothetical protein M1816_004888 [Peltula sp. TS41687]